MTATLTRTEPATPVRGGAAPRLTIALFTATSFVGAGLLFIVQPLVARLVLPAFGGSATVWSTSSLFFQVALLLGYLYSHASMRRWGARWQPRLHLLVVLVPFVVLPITLPSDAAPPSGASTVLWLLRVLALTVGLPFLVLSTTGPLLQRWYSWTGAPRADDPYFLFAASNFGSFGGLLAYPFLVEPHLALAAQQRAWSVGFCLFAALVVLCGLRVQGARTAHGGGSVESTSAELSSPLGWRRMLRWATLAFLPSGLMLAVTAHISTDVAPIPLLWVVTLAIYLATFVVAFGRTKASDSTLGARFAVSVTFAAGAATMMEARAPVIAAVALDMVMLGAVAMVAHCRLAADRPEANRLTAYYLVVAGGGALGGLLNGLVAPLVFDRILEYSILSVLVPLVLLARAKTSTRQARGGRSSSPRSRLVTLALGMPAALAVGLLLTRLVDVTVLVYGAFALTLVAGWLLSSQRLVVALVIGSTFLVSSVRADFNAIEHSRTFFGSYRVMESAGQRQFAHGTTVHGTQWLDSRRSEPTAYYGRQGPLGDIMGRPGVRDVAVVGTGVGTIAAYGATGQRFTFIDIDAEVIRIAKDPALFTYLRDSAAEVHTVAADGRLAVAKMPPASLDVLVLDAFSSDAIPVHLLTQEAMRTYASRLRPGGVMVVHISNKVFDLAPVLAGAQQDLGWTGRIRDDVGGPERSASRWVALSATPTSFERLAHAAEWVPLLNRRVTWTDDYSSILPVLVVPR